MLLVASCLYDNVQSRGGGGGGGGVNRCGSLLTFLSSPLPGQEASFVGF